ncbi:hypothetical protein CIRG_00931 [Coccidioides immitis RMSCC 2394]|uniref:Uncharacterized protein n=1 Tax=Coccidioides immitis RMSCC 2394 TaxID=404692 RepID=A0A0J6Y1B4_COCIT|nr:hypothetical protein CIRG_00931 [Coccidioides immitis RMSCC 2394]
MGCAAFTKGQHCVSFANRRPKCSFKKHETRIVYAVSFEISRGSAAGGSAYLAKQSVVESTPQTVWRFASLHSSQKCGQQPWYAGRVAQSISQRQASLPVRKVRANNDARRGACLKAHMLLLRGVRSVTRVHAEAEAHSCSPGPSLWRAAKEAKLIG